jgi:hypothetical protein
MSQVVPRWRSVVAQRLELKEPEQVDVGHRQQAEGSGRRARWGAEEATAAVLRLTGWPRLERAWWCRWRG